MDARMALICYDGAMPHTTPVSRTEAIMVRCAYCRAKPGERCKGLRRVRLQCHLERHREAARVKAQIDESTKGMT